MDTSMLAQALAQTVVPKDVSREQLDSLIRIHAELKALHEKQHKLMDELVVALWYKHTWPEWAEYDGKDKSADLKTRGAISLQTSGIRTEYARSRMFLRMTMPASTPEQVGAKLLTGKESKTLERTFPAITLPDAVWTYLWERYKRQWS